MVQATKAVRSFRDEYLLELINLDNVDAVHDQDVDERVLSRGLVANIEKTIAALGKPGTLFPGLDPFNRRALIRALVRNVRVFETTIDITLDLAGLGVSPTDVPLPDADRDDRYPH